MTAEGAGCDAPPGTAGLYIIGTDDGGALTYGCRCIVCARCGHHTGNSTQGHFWSWCQTAKEMLEPHFCCPGDCEYGPVK